MSAARSYPRPTMSPRSTPPSSADPAAPDDDTPEAAFWRKYQGKPDLSALPVVGITRRRMAFLGAAFATVWIVIIFARQVGEASAASGRVEHLRQANAQLAAEVDALEREFELIQGEPYILLQARAYGVGGPRDIAFTLSERQDLPEDAPGSAAVRLGAHPEPDTPLESWLSLLFGPSS
jgi:cell division protein FtsB